MGEGGYIRVQNKSTYDVTVKVTEGRRVDDRGMKEIQGPIAVGGQLPVTGKSKFGSMYQYIEGDVRFRVQKDGFFGLEVHVEGSSPSGLKLMVDHNSWWSEDKSPDKDSFVKLVADVDEEDGESKIEIRIFNNYKGNSWMSELYEHIENTPLCLVGLPGTHDSGTYTFNTEMGASPDSDLTSTIQDKLDHGILLGKVNDFILRNVFERLCRCQDKSIKEQLEAGIRYLDLRVAFHEESGTYWTCHGVYCVDMKVVIDQVNEFLTTNPKVCTAQWKANTQHIHNDDSSLHSSPQAVPLKYRLQRKLSFSISITCTRWTMTIVTRNALTVCWGLLVIRSPIENPFHLKVL
jgi:hypothetical protein